jgi:large conductance mechanosensitive channel
MSVLQEFKKFALRGNVIDMAVGIIIGAAFGTVVRSLVDDVIMPPIGMLTSDVDFKNLKYVLRPGVPDPAKQREFSKPPVTLNYGAFINNVITFLMVARAVFLLVKAMNVADEKLRFGHALKPDATPPPEDIQLLREIRDALKRS